MQGVKIKMQIVKVSETVSLNERLLGDISV